MRILGQVDIATYESEDDLLFVVSRTYGWTNYFVIAVLAVLVVWAWNSDRPVTAMVIAVVGGGSLIINWAQGPETRLRVSSQLLVADGNLERTFTSEIKIPLSEITSIGWSSDGEDGPSGLFIWRGWQSSCVLPGISREQADSIRSTILGKYPDLERDAGPASILHGNDSGNTQLGIESGNPEGASKR